MRSNGWPSEKIIAEVIAVGFDVVPVTHPDFKDNQFQWRASFSKAEIILINSWTPKQQMIYHLLRFFIKHELNKNLSDKDILVKTYYIKSLMLWACEEKLQIGGPLRIWRYVLNCCKSCAFVSRISSVEAILSRIAIF